MQPLFRSMLCAACLLCFTAATDAQTQTPSNQHRIQLAILLDTSSSMDGLIDQTRTQLWSMVDELSKAKKNGQNAALEVAVLEYGNSGLAAGSGFIRTVTHLTSDLDRVSEALFSLRTNGGDEYCGYVIQTAVNNLQWSQSPQDLKLIYIAGNEPFTQGPVHHDKAIQLAKQKDITISTIFAGNYEEGASSGWQSGALLAGGNFMNVDQNQQLVHIVAPQDQRILELNKKLNETYVAYGAKGRESKVRQQEQDAANTQASVAVMASRIKSKVSAAYKNESWDLVDAMAQEDFDLETIPAEQLPEPIVLLSSDEKREWLESKKNEREAVKQEIDSLVQERDRYIAEERKKLADSEDDSVNEVLTKSIKEQAQKLNYAF